MHDCSMCVTWKGKRKIKYSITSIDKTPAGNGLKRLILGR